MQNCARCKHGSSWEPELGVRAYYCSAHRNDPRYMKQGTTFMLKKSYYSKNICESFDVARVWGYGEIKLEV